MDQTIDYYNQNAEKYREDTINVDMHSCQDKFLQLLPEKAHILDFGCGSGRDTRYFLDHGYLVTAVDGSSELCRLATEYAKIPVRQMLFQELDDKDLYDGIWACSSILHLPKEELLPVFHKMSTALKNMGVIYTSFKYSNFEGERNGRHFTDFTEKAFQDFLAAVPELTIVDYWITGDVRPGRGEEKWLNLLLHRADIH